ncbi:MAG TPA: LytTR family DNA-binding domain-containing protein [Gammaproteobacteria bacterium]|jgi:two-component system LytT family response regulator
MIKVLVVDDEPHARQKLVRFIDMEPDLKLAGVCQNGLELVEKVRELHPDLLFLDVQMPELSGFEALERMDREHRPYVIFTTAYSEYGAQAFEVEAVDYLLKPFDAGRFERAVNRARRLFERQARVGSDAVARQVEAALERRLGRRRLMVKVGTAIRPLDPGEILYLRSAGDYLKLKLPAEELRIRERMKDIEEQLADAGVFVRIHRSALVNLAHVREMKPKQHGDYEFRMSDGMRLVSGATYRANVRRLLEQRGRHD